MNSTRLNQFYSDTLSKRVDVSTNKFKENTSSASQQQQDQHRQLSTTPSISKTVSYTFLASLHDVFNVEFFVHSPK